MQVTATESVHAAAGAMCRNEAYQSSIEPITNFLLAEDLLPDPYGTTSDAGL